MVVEVKDINVSKELSKEPKHIGFYQWMLVPSLSWIIAVIRQYSGQREEKLQMTL